MNKIFRLLFTLIVCICLFTLVGCKVESSNEKMDNSNVDNNNKVAVSDDSNSGSSKTETADTIDNVSTNLDDTKIEDNEDDDVEDDKTDLVILVADITNNVPKVNLDLSIWNQEYFQNEEALKEKQVEFNNTIYNGTYEKSIIRKCESFVRNVYTDETGIRFEINEKTGELVLLNLMNYDFFETEPFKEEVEDSENNALELAKEIAKDYIDVIDYELLIEDSVTREFIKDDEKYYMTYYTFTFAKKVNGIYSSDYVSIKITSKGNLASLYIGDIGAFDGKDIIIPLDEINNANQDKIKNIFAQVNFSVLNQEVTIERLAITPDGEVSLYRAFKVSLDGIDSLITMNAGICLVTYIK